MCYVRCLPLQSVTTSAGGHRAVLPREESAKERQVEELTLPPSSPKAERAYSCSGSRQLETPGLDCSRGSVVDR
jgi:hypothetical protein